MIPVHQTKFVGGLPKDNPAAAGNCMQAAIASLMELTLDDVPHFGAVVDPKDEMAWWKAIVAFLNENGYGIVVMTEPMANAMGLMSGQSPRGDFTHLVVSRGREMIHDPHPSGDGVTDPFEWWYLVPHTHRPPWRPTCDELTLDQVETYLRSRICPAGEPWTANDPLRDHGHTECYFIGTAVRMLQQLKGRPGFPCPDDTDGDGKCWRKFCVFCGGTGRPLNKEF